MPKLLKRMIFIGVPIFALVVIIAGVVIGTTYLGGRNAAVWEYIHNPQDHPDWEVAALGRCEDSVFVMPSSGFIGYLWQDKFKLFTRHQGIDIFAGEEPGVTPVYAPYDGYLTREEGWKSSMIIRVPDDPLQPGRQIWLYMTHMADAEGNDLISADFHEGTYDVPVSAGELLGYQGNYSGDPHNPVGVHLHFSIVKDDGQGRYLNELEVENTLDPSPYFNLFLDARSAPEGLTLCGGEH